MTHPKPSHPKPEAPQCYAPLCCRVTCATVASALVALQLQQSARVLGLLDESLRVPVRYALNPEP